MSEPIKKGDFVMVVRHSGCPCPPKSLGKIFVVARIENGRGVCSWCGTKTVGSVSAYTADGAGYGLYRLRKIDPLSEPESIETKEEMPA